MIKIKHGMLEMQGSFSELTADLSCIMKGLSDHGYKESVDLAYKTYDLDAEEYDKVLDEAKKEMEELIEGMQNMFVTASILSKMSPQEREELRRKMNENRNTD
jgi:DNA-binding MarR family transcriptional regulator